MEEVMKAPEKGAENVEPAPKIVHFVWAGGVTPIPDKSLRVVVSWLNKNPDFTVYLWIDEKTCGNIQRLIRYYQENAADNLVFWEEEQTTKGQLAISHGLIPGKIILRDIDRNNITNMWIRYFIERISPNYGMSSDLVRLRILKEFGGAYFDSDVSPGENPLCELSIFKDKGKHRALLDDFTQISILENEDLISPFDLNSSRSGQHIGNDVLASTKGNPLMECLLQFSIQRLMETKKFPKRRFAFCYGSQDIKGFSIFATGPDSLQVCLRTFKRVPNNRTQRGGFDLLIDAPSSERPNYHELTVVEINPIRYVGCTPILPLRPTHNWLKVPKTIYSNQKDLMNAVRKMVMFECGCFEMVRVDDHIEDLIELSERFDANERFDEEKAFEFLNNLVFQGKKPHSRFLLKVTGKFRTSANHFKDFLPKNPEDIREMVACIGYWGTFGGFFHQDKKVENSEHYLQQLAKDYAQRKAVHPALPSLLKIINESVGALGIYCEPERCFLEANLLQIARSVALECIEKYSKFLTGVLQIMSVSHAPLGNRGEEQEQRAEAERQKFLSETQELLKRISMYIEYIKLESQAVKQWRWF